MSEVEKGLQGLQAGADVLFVLVGAILVFAMHGGFAFLEAGTVRHKNQVNALCKILVDFAISTLCYFFIGYAVAYGISFLASAEDISGGAKGFEAQGFSLVKFFFLATFAAAVPAIISGGIAERARGKPRPQHDAVGERIARGDAKRERIFRQRRLRGRRARRDDGGSAGKDRAS